MSLLDKLKALIGVGDSGSTRREERDVSATVEREPDRDTGDSTAGESPQQSVEEDEPTEETTDPDSSEPEVEAGGPAETANDGGAVGQVVEERDGEDEEAEESEVDEEEETQAPSEAVDVIKGIGPTYAGRLSDAGVETVVDLAEADPDDIADQADVPRGRVEDWIERAKVRTR